MALTRRTDRGVSNRDTPMSLDCPFGKAYPGLAEFVSQTKWPDGSERVCGTLLLLCEDGRAKVWVNDKDGGVSCWVSGDTLAAALKAAEKAVTGTGGDWRAPPKGKGRR